MSCKDNKDGSCSVEYIPFTPGEYDVNITFGGLPIPGDTSELFQLACCRVGCGSHFIDSLCISGAEITHSWPLYVLQGVHFGFQCESWWIPVK